jgi:D-alanyl-D-alanine carboxypeptidase
MSLRNFRNAKSSAPYFTTPLILTLALLLAGSLLHSRALAQTGGSASSAGLDSTEEQKIAQMLADSGAPSVSIAIVDNGSLVYAKAFGKATVSPDRAADEHTRYAVGSISKQFTSAAILYLVQQGKISLDDKVYKFFPDLTHANEITVRELLSHTSGYEDYAPQDYMIPEWLKPITPQEILDKWAKKPLNFDPGTRWQYSNTNYVLAGRIFEKASGQPLVPFLKKTFFEPLHMDTAGDCSVDKTPQDAIAYTRYAWGPPRPALREAAGWYFAAGELCMTPSDLARWDISFLHQKMLSPASYETMEREVHLKNGDRTHYGLGLQLNDLDNIPRIAHGGEVSGFLASNATYPTRDAAVIVLSNQDGINLIGAATDEISRWLLEPEKRITRDQASDQEIQQVSDILKDLQQGKIDRSLLTSNLNFYFNDQALSDIQNSIGSLGALKSVVRTRDVLRGGMEFRFYHAEFEKRGCNISVYFTPDGKYEQFIIEQQL